VVRVKRGDANRHRIKVVNQIKQKNMKTLKAKLNSGSSKKLVREKSEKGPFFNFDLLPTLKPPQKTDEGLPWFPQKLSTAVVQRAENVFETMAGDELDESASSPIKRESKGRDIKEKDEPVQVPILVPI